MVDLTNLYKLYSLLNSSILRIRRMSNDEFLIDNLVLTPISSTKFTVEFTFGDYMHIHTARETIEISSVVAENATVNYVDSPCCYVSTIPIKFLIENMVARHLYGLTKSIPH